MDVDVGIVAQRDNERAQTLAVTLLETLADEDVTVTVDEETGTAIGVAGAPVSEMESCDLVVSIGGDGTFLFVARETDGAALVGVNLGEVGFLNAVAPEEAVVAVSELVADLQADGRVDGVCVDRLRASGEGWDLEPALNEVVVHGPRRGRGGGAEIEVRVDGERYTSGHADGVLVATPTGSTAYNLSEGGPLLQPSVDALVITQMAASDSMPPLVVGADSEVTLHVSGTERAWSISDGRNRRPLEPPTTVTVTVADEPLTIAGPRTNFFDALEKLE